MGGSCYLAEWSNCSDTIMGVTSAYYIPETIVEHFHFIPPRYAHKVTPSSIHPSSLLPPPSLPPSSMLPAPFPQFLPPKILSAAVTAVFRPPSGPRVTVVWAHVCVCSYMQCVHTHAMVSE